MRYEEFVIFHPPSERPRQCQHLHLAPVFTSWKRSWEWLTEKQLRGLSKRSWDRQKRARSGKAERVRQIRMHNMEDVIAQKHPGA